MLKIKFIEKSHCQLSRKLKIVYSFPYNILSKIVLWTFSYLYINQNPIRMKQNYLVFILLVQVVIWFGFIIKNKELHWLIRFHFIPKSNKPDQIAPLFRTQRLKANTILTFPIFESVPKMSPAFLLTLLQWSFQKLIPQLLDRVARIVHNFSSATSYMYTSVWFRANLSSLIMV